MGSTGAKRDSKKRERRVGKTTKRVYRGKEGYEDNREGSKEA